MRRSNFSSVSSENCETFFWFSHTSHTHTRGVLCCWFFVFRKGINAFLLCLCVDTVAEKKNAPMIFLFFWLSFFHSLSWVESSRFTWNASLVATSGSLDSLCERTHKRNCKFVQWQQQGKNQIPKVLSSSSSSSVFFPLFVSKTTNFGFGKGIRMGRVQWIHFSNWKSERKESNVLNARYK